MSIPTLIADSHPMAIWVGLTALALVGFALALGRIRIGWPLAAIGVIGATLRSALFGQWSRLVAPLHMLSGGLWLGTLFVLVFAGLSTVLFSSEARDRRGPLVANLVHAFSPLALGMGGSLVLWGAILAWQKLGTLSALWTTKYGVVLIVKLCAVAIVFALGAWNWRSQRPKLGSETAALSIRTSAKRELIAALVVLLITAVLGTLPVPSEERQQARPSAAAR